MNTEELKEMVENCMETERVETAASDILFYAQYSDIPRILEILIDKVKNK